MDFRHLALVAVLALLVTACATPEPTFVPTLEEPTMVIPTAVNLAPRPTEPLVAGAGITTTGLLTTTGGLTVTEGITATGAVTATQPMTYTIDPATLAVLENMTYTLDGRTYTLVDGVYDNPAEYTNVQLFPPAATGDLSGDGVDDAAVLLAQSTGGSGTFIYLAPVVDEAGVMTNTESLLLGDRVKINDMTIADGTISLSVVTHGPSDPMCCPTLAQTWTFALTDGKLTQTSVDGPTL
jgi:hypothetical protein